MNSNQIPLMASILKRGPGGTSPNESGMNAQMNFGQGHGHSMFSTMPAMGHALSGTPLGQVDDTLQNAQARLARFAAGGEVKKPAGPSAKERSEIRSLIERGKQDAISALRSTRSALIQSQMPPTPAPAPPPVAAPVAPAAPPPDYSAALDKLSQRLTMKDGGDVAAQAQQASPQGMYQEYTELLDDLENGEDNDPQLHMHIVDRLADLETKLGALGVSLPGADPKESP